MAEMEPQGVAANVGSSQLAQTVVYTSHGWCFDDGLDVYCSWYPADVVIVDASWVEFVPQRVDVSAALVAGIHVLK